MRSRSNTVWLVTQVTLSERLNLNLLTCEQFVHIALNWLLQTIEFKNQ